MCMHTRMIQFHKRGTIEFHSLTFCIGNERRNCQKSIGNKVLLIIYVCELPLKSSTTIIVYSQIVYGAAMHTCVHSMRTAIPYIDEFNSEMEI